MKNSFLFRRLPGSLLLYIIHKKVEDVKGMEGFIDKSAFVVFYAPDEFFKYLGGEGEGIEGYGG